MLNPVVSNSTVNSFGVIEPVNVTVSGRTYLPASAPLNWTLVRVISFSVPTFLSSNANSAVKVTS